VATEGKSFWAFTSVEVKHLNIVSILHSEEVPSIREFNFMRLNFDPVEFLKFFLQNIKAHDVVCEAHDHMESGRMNGQASGFVIEFLSDFRFQFVLGAVVPDSD
jgi:hypothetical protein